MARENPASRIRDAFQRVGGDRGRLLWYVGAAAILVIIAFRSCVTIEPGHVAVRVNNLTGSVETITQPGLVLRLPFGIHSSTSSTPARRPSTCAGPRTRTSSTSRS